MSIRRHLIEGGRLVLDLFNPSLEALASRQEGQELGEEILPGVHRQVLSAVFCGKAYGIPGGTFEIDAAENVS